MFDEVDALTPAAGEVVISVKACGVNFPDTLIIQNLYQFKPALPFSPGGEVAGIVKSVGTGVTHVNVGDAVIGFTGWGGYAEEARCAAAQVIAMPPDITFPVAASFTLAYGTSYHALKDRAQLKAGETLLVLGAAGGVGLAACEIGAAMGARVIACASSNDKLAICKQYGATEVINYNDENLRERLNDLTNKRGVDVVYDPVGGAYSEPALRAMAWKGRYLVVGFAAGEIPKIALNLTLLKGIIHHGRFWGAFLKNEPQLSAANIEALVTMITSGKLKPLVSATYPLARAADALNDVMARRVVGKVVLVT
ncbi:MAG: NADPH:quinone oxidoreductase family protein [Gammaproteobacteria bacterium]|nr:NADPH:quinone oxidoreductase family protein [Gammaproteobacteria bacterium]